MSRIAAALRMLERIADWTARERTGQRAPAPTTSRVERADLPAMRSGVDPSATPPPRQTAPKRDGVARRPAR